MYPSTWQVKVGKAVCYFTKREIVNHDEKLSASKINAEGRMTQYIIRFLEVREYGRVSG